MLPFGSSILISDKISSKVFKPEFELSLGLVSPISNISKLLKSLELEISCGLVVVVNVLELKTFGESLLDFFFLFTNKSSPILLSLDGLILKFGFETGCSIFGIELELSFLIILIFCGFSELFKLKSIFFKSLSISKLISSINIL